MSPAWESISAARHLLLMLTTPFHSVTCYELPVYFPSREEREDPKVYAAGVRQYMVSGVLFLIGDREREAGRGSKERKQRGGSRQRKQRAERCGREQRHKHNCTANANMAHNNNTTHNNPHKNTQTQLDWSDRLGVGLTASDATLDDKRRYQADLKLRLAAAAEEREREQEGRRQQRGGPGRQRRRRREDEDGGRKER